MRNDHVNRSGLLPDGCKDLIDALRLQAKQNETPPPILHTNEEIREVFRRHVPEVASGVVEILTIVRNIGRRCLLLVRSNSPEISAVKACSLESRERIRTVVAELGGEFPSVLAWNASQEVMIRNAFGGLEQVTLDSQARQATVAIHPMTKNRVIVGGEDQLVRMISELAGLVGEATGWRIQVVDHTPPTNA